LALRFGLLKAMWRSHHANLFTAPTDRTRLLRWLVPLLPMFSLALPARAAEPKTNAFYQADSTRRMAERLEQIARTVVAAPDGRASRTCARFGHSIPSRRGVAKSSYPAHAFAKHDFRRACG
jgi:hypothetical protein